MHDDYDDPLDDDPAAIWQLEYDDVPDDGFVDGLRLSTDCVARRIIEPLDPDRYHSFPEHLSKRGHGFERVFKEWLLAKFGVASIREVVVPWEYGESHLDLFLPDPGRAFDTDGKPLQIELKANRDASVKPENVRQVQRQRFAVERAIEQGRVLRARVKDDAGTWVWQRIDPALYADADWRILVIDPTTWRIPNPKGTRVRISDERRDELEQEWATMKEVMSRPIHQLRADLEWPGKIAACTCGKCDPEAQVFELPANLVDAAQRYLWAMGEERDAKAAKELEASILKPGMRKILERWPDLLDKKQSFVGGGVKVTLTKSGSIRVTTSDAKPTPMF